MAILDETKPFKTLQELAASKTIAELLKSGKPAEEFQSFDDHEQRLVFAQLIKDFAHLKHENDYYKRCKERTPYLDWQLRTKYHGRTRSADEISEISDASTESAQQAKWDAKEAEKETEEWKSKNGYCLKERFLEDWHYSSEAEREAGQDRRTFDRELMNNRFDVSTLCSHGAEGDLVVCEYPGRMQDTPACGHSYESHREFWYKISSQLLYYRVTTIFGMPPSDENDGYKVAWWAHLTYKDGKSRLDIGDWKGHASTNYYGNAEGRESALALLNFLTGLNCPHTYDGVLAGTSA
ncbi:hypothetical protein H2200_006972 [Cladophialophora chaetospira]|uniref:Uncharacterized protein n=1 Tax=Cladophialophora chaetospira TaxID=386627 RepID=A0AA38X9E2_9EURO|nr:hypothetical protein H2200_006972 [Cladophialophora chaetospira]